MYQKGGFVFISTMNKTISSYLLIILGAEYLTRMIPIGTHNWNNFVKVEDLEKWATQSGLKVVNNQGFQYNFLENSMIESTNKDVNYFIACQKL